jgi:hypothetical protein
VPLLLKKDAPQQRIRMIALQSGSGYPPSAICGEIHDCGRKSPARRNLFGAPSVIHGDRVGLVAAQTRRDYFCGAA